METEVSEEVKKAAREYADSRYVRYRPGSRPGSHYWHEVYNAFIAGAAYNKPQEHNAIPEKEKLTH